MPAVDVYMDYALFCRFGAIIALIHCMIIQTPTREQGRAVIKSEATFVPKRQRMINETPVTLSGCLSLHAAK